MIMFKPFSRQDAKPAKENQNKIFLAFFAPLRETGSQKASSPGNLVVGRSQE